MTELDTWPEQEADLEASYTNEEAECDLTPEEIQQKNTRLTKHWKAVFNDSEHPDDWNRFKAHYNSLVSNKYRIEE